MAANPLLKKLGYSDTDRLVIVHADDIGLSQASIQAYQDLWTFGTISSGAVMVPCPWFPTAAHLCREHPGMDMGVHATLNSEWDTVRWGPVSTRDPASGLLDAGGFLPQGHEAVYENARPEAVAAELETQIERALAAGIDVTHVDSHMGTSMHPNFIQSYVQAAASRGLPNMLPRLDARGIERMGLSQEQLAAYAPVMEQLQAMGIPMLDGILSMPLEHDRDHLEVARRVLGEAPAGITHFILHPAVDTPELRALCTTDWPARAANYRAFMSDELKLFLEREAIQLIGYRALRDAMRTPA